MIRNYENNFLPNTRPPHTVSIYFNPILRLELIPTEVSDVTSYPRITHNCENYEKHGFAYGVYPQSTSPMSMLQARC